MEVKVVDIFSEMAKHEETTYRSFDGGQSLELLQKLLALVGKDKDETIMLSFQKWNSSDIDFYFILDNTLFYISGNKQNNLVSS